MNVVHVVAGLPAAGGGLAAAVTRLAREAAGLGHDVTIATVAEAAADSGVSFDGSVLLVRFAPSFPRRLHCSREMLRGLPPLVAAADVVHVHSAWTFPVWWGGHTALAADVPLVMSPHGAVSPVQLAHSAWKKRVAGLVDRRLLRQADLIHAASLAERAWIERYVGAGARIEVIPLGVDLPAPRQAAATADRTRRVLSLGRLHPCKGLDLLLDAWRLAMRDVAAGDSWELVIAGPDEQGTRGTLEQRARELGLANVRFVGPLHGEEKVRAWAAADLFVLPSRSENFGMVVPEALAAGLPVVTTKGTPWREIDGSCGWWVDAAAGPLAAALAAAMRLGDDDRRSMGARGRGLVESAYRWPVVGRAMVDLYDRIRRPRTAGPTTRGR